MDMQYSTNVPTTFQRECLALLTELSLESVLLKTAKLASSQTDASYAICGLADIKNQTLTKYRVTGFLSAEIKRLGLNLDSSKNHIHVQLFDTSMISGDVTLFFDYFFFKP